MRIRTRSSKRIEYEGGQVYANQSNMRRHFPKDGSSFLYGTVKRKSLSILRWGEKPEQSCRFKCNDEMNKSELLPQRGTASAVTRILLNPGGGGSLLSKINDRRGIGTDAQDESQGDPMTEQKWIRSSLSRLSGRLADEGHQASSSTVARLLKKMGFSLKANKRKQGMSGCPDRDEQFNDIATQKQQFITAV